MSGYDIKKYKENTLDSWMTTIDNDNNINDVLKKYYVTDGLISQYHKGDNGNEDYDGLYFSSNDTDSVTNNVSSVIALMLKNDSVITAYEYDSNEQDIQISLTVFVNGALTAWIDIDTYEATIDITLNGDTIKSYSGTYGTKVKSATILELITNPTTYGLKTTAASVNK